MTTRDYSLTIYISFCVDNVKVTMYLQTMDYELASQMQNISFSVDNVKVTLNKGTHGVVTNYDMILHYSLQN